MDNQLPLILKPTHTEVNLGVDTMTFDPSPPRTPIPEIVAEFGIRRCPTFYLHHKEADTYHPISFRPYFLPGGSDAPMVRWKSIGHHTTGMSGLPAARNFVLDHPNCMEIGGIWEWDGTTENAAKVIFLPEEIYAQAVSGDYQPA
jgi:hypothetical protein